MTSERTRIGIVGTFDVRNYGDLLFPLLAERALSDRLDDVDIQAFSYHERHRPAWPFRVRSLTELPDAIAGLDALLIGGGFVVRFDPDVAPGYGPTTPDIHHPTGYWLTPALLAAQHGVPVVWNAPGMHENDVPDWAEPLTRAALDVSRYIAVRDDATRDRLAPVTDAPITVVPDTAFGLGDLRNAATAQQAADLRASLGLDPAEPYVVVQPAVGSREFAEFVRHHAADLRDLRFLLLPIGPALGDDADVLPDVPGAVTVPDWPDPVLLAELVAGAVGVVGHSYHLAISALTAGVPVLTPTSRTDGKYAALAPFTGVAAFEPDAGVAGLRARFVRTDPDPAVTARQWAVNRHWDRVAEVVRAGRVDSAPTTGRLWQRLPTLLERPVHSVRDSAALTAQHEVERAADRARIAELERVLHLAQRTAAQRQDAVNRLQESPSWRVTAPLRHARQRLRRAPGAPGDILSLSRLLHTRLEREPFTWASPGGLYAPEDAQALADTYPHDHFKTVSARGGEKDYDYDVRELVRMSDATVSRGEHLSPAWRRLAEDLRSPQYRAVMSIITGTDLTDAPLEVNAYHFGPRALLGAHTDLPDKLVTHVLYFNDSWNPSDGGCLSILASNDPEDRVTEITPHVGNSAVLVRSDRSWHAVTPVVATSRASRRSVTAVFYRPGSTTPMWPAGDDAPLRTYAVS